MISTIVGAQLTPIAISKPTQFLLLRVQPAIHHPRPAGFSRAWTSESATAAPRHSERFNGDSWKQRRIFKGHQQAACGWWAQDLYFQALFFGWFFGMNLAMGTRVLTHSNWFVAGPQGYHQWFGLVETPWESLFLASVQFTGSTLGNCIDVLLVVC